MNKIIFIGVEGGLIQNVTVTNDLDGIKAVVIDFDADGVQDSGLTQIDDHQAMVYSHAINKIDDGNVEHFEDILRRSES